MNYLKDGPFSVALGSERYRDNWDATFGRGKDETEPDNTERDDMALYFEMLRSLKELVPSGDAELFLVHHCNGAGWGVRLNCAIELQNLLLQVKHG